MDEYRQKLWNNLIKLGRKREPETNGSPANHLTKEDITTIIATLDFFDVTKAELAQAYWDLNTAKYRLFDWLAMCLGGRITERENKNDPIIALANIYLNVNTWKQFIDFLRYVDLEPFIGKFDTKEFTNFIKRWTKEDEKTNKSNK
ncbi:MAG: hypothetical protein QXL51_04475 [Candidatus Aenigmatarchaeota archaeon]